MGHRHRGRDQELRDHGPDRGHGDVQGRGDPHCGRRQQGHLPRRHQVRQAQGGQRSEPHLHRLPAPGQGDLRVRGRGPQAVQVRLPDRHRDRELQGPLRPSALRALLSGRRAVRQRQRGRNPAAVADPRGQDVRAVEVRGLGVGRGRGRRQGDRQLDITWPHLQRNLTPHDARE